MVLINFQKIKQVFQAIDRKRKHERMINAMENGQWSDIDYIHRKMKDAQNAIYTKWVHRSEDK